MIKDVTGRQLRVGDQIVHATTWSSSIHWDIKRVLDILPDKPKCLVVEATNYKGEVVGEKKITAKNVVRIG